MTVTTGAAGTGPRARGRSVGVLVAVVLLATGCVLAPLPGRPEPGPPPGQGRHRFAATGFFRIERDGERWWFVTPDGDPFYSHGVNHVTPAPDTDRATGQCPYCAAVAANYPDTTAWAGGVVDRLRSWGFNTIGAWSTYDLFTGSMPVTPLLGMAGGNDWFAPAFEQRAESIAATRVAPRRDDPNVIGWLLDNELRWGRDWRGPEPMLTSYLALPDGAPGRAVAERHRGDPSGFLRELADRYYEVTTGAIRAVDPNHLILGTRLVSFFTPTEVVEEAGRWLDVLSVNHYPVVDGLIEGANAAFGPFVPVTDDLAEFHARSGLPVMVTEWSYRAADTDVPNSWPPIYPTRPDQAARAASYAARVQALYAAPWIVGDHWFEYVDQPPGGRFDGEDSNFGLVSNADVPYATLTGRMTAEHAVAPDALALAGSPHRRCLAWTRVQRHTVCTVRR